ncbi:hypothetical protein TNCV_3064081 [Trichonephila clavipes]|nr:hypothetical protein TNCV_3064081 [Trichonephila clavipes]
MYYYLIFEKEIKFGWQSKTPVKKCERKEKKLKRLIAVENPLPQRTLAKKLQESQSTACRQVKKVGFKNFKLSKPNFYSILRVYSTAATPNTAVGIFGGPDTHTCFLQLQRNPFLTLEESNPVDRKMRGRDALNLHGSGS